MKVKNIEKCSVCGHYQLSHKEQFSYFDDDYSYLSCKALDAAGDECGCGGDDNTKQLLRRTRN